MTKRNELKVTTPSDREIAMTRVFSAPRRLVWKAVTTPDLIKRWMSHSGAEMTVCSIDLRVGGRARYEWTFEGGNKMGMDGEYREIAEPERIVMTEKFDEAWYPGEAIGTQTLVEHGEETTFTMLVRYDSKETRDAVLKSPMSDGVGRGLNLLEDLLSTLA